MPQTLLLAQALIPTLAHLLFVRFHEPPNQRGVPEDLIVVIGLGGLGPLDRLWSGPGGRRRFSLRARAHFRGHALDEAVPASAGQ
ncbi:hypothetical protein ACQEVX_30230 [Streptomyces syringium]|uniref:hypothetical protein n=1 Tax=Streptomyces syringium TaxID=76729 RepID=UPI003D913EBB